MDMLVHLLDLPPEEPGLTALAQAGIRIRRAMAPDKAGCPLFSRLQGSQAVSMGGAARSSVPGSGRRKKPQKWSLWKWETSRSVGRSSSMALRMAE